MGRREKLRLAKNYALYYGVGKADILAAYDLAIVEPLGQSSANIKLVHQTEKLVLAYVSVVEINPDHPLFHLLKAEDFLMINGQPCKNEAYGTFMLDLRSKRWLGILNHHIGHLIHNEDYDGIFMDTIGDVEMHNIPQGMRLIQIQAAVKWIEQLRAIFPEHILIQNNGLDALCLETAQWIDAICWENPPFTIKSAEAWTKDTIARLNFLQKQYQIMILMLFEQISEKMLIKTVSLNTALDYGFLSYTAPHQYVADVVKLTT